MTLTATQKAAIIETGFGLKAMAGLHDATRSGEAQITPARAMEIASEMRIRSRDWYAPEMLEMARYVPLADMDGGIVDAIVGDDMLPLFER